MFKVNQRVREVKEVINNSRNIHMKRVRDLSVGQTGLIEMQNMNGENGWLKATLISHEHGEYIMTTDKGDRYTMDGWEQIK